MKFRKFLATISALSATILAGASVVACGPITFQKLMNRKVNTETFYGELKAPVDNWSSATTMESQNNTHTANLADAWLQNDEYNNIIGDLADGWEANADFTEWKLHVNPEAEWFDYQGRKVSRDGTDHYQIKASHLANTLRFIYNPASQAQTKGLWNQLLQSATELDDVTDKLAQEQTEGRDLNANDIVKNNSDMDYEIAKYINFVQGPTNTQNWTQAQRDGYTSVDKPIIKVDDETNEITFYMNNPTEFFPSVLCYVAFSPLPNEAIDWFNKTPINANNYGSTYQTIYNSGAYYVTTYKPAVQMIMKANPNYRNQEDLHIKKLVFYASRSSQPSMQRLRLETGDMSSLILNPNDTGGWSKYVGKGAHPSDPEKDIDEDINFEGAHFQETPNYSSWVFHYNFAYDDGSTSVESNPINWAMAKPSTRALIDYALNRQIYNHYFTRNVDPDGQEISSLSLNHYTATKLIPLDNLDNPNLADPDLQGLQAGAVKDKVTNYLDLYSDQYLKFARTQAKALDTEADFQTKTLDYSKVLQDGQEAFLKNDFIAYHVINDEALKTEFKTPNRSYEDKIQTLIKQVNKDYQADGISFNSNNPVRFRWLTPSNWLVNQYPAVLEMVRQFNNIYNNPIRIDLEAARDDADFRTQRRMGHTSLTTAGWSPDYNDPSSFLNTLLYEGDYSGYNRFHLVIDRDGDGFKAKNSHFEALTKDVTEYNKAVITAATEQGATRYNAFAREEVNLIFNYMFITPIYNEHADYSPMISYLDPFTLTTVEAGTSKSKYLRQKMIPQLWNRETFKEKQAEYEVNRNKIRIKNFYPSKIK